MPTPTLLDTRPFVIQRLAADDPDELFRQACAEFADHRIEQDPEGNLHIMSPTGGKTGNRNSKINYFLTEWALRDGRGETFDSSTCFILPDQRKVSPDAAWVSNERLNELSPEELETFPRVVPDFVIELLSPSDDLRELQRKMVGYLENGVSLGWLLDPLHHTLYVYDQQGIRTYRDCDLAIGEGPVQVFTLDLRQIW